MGCAASCSTGGDGGESDESSAQVWVPEQWFVKWSHGRLVTRRLDRTDSTHSDDDDLETSTSVRGSSTAGFASVNTGPSQSDSTGDDFDPLASDIAWNYHLGGGASTQCSLSDFSSDGRLTDEPSRPYTSMRESAYVLRARLSHGINGELEQFEPLAEPHEFVRLSLRRVREWWDLCGLGERRLGRSPPQSSEDPRGRGSTRTNAGNSSTRTGSLENSPRGTSAIAVRRRRRVAVTTDALELHDRLTSWPPADPQS
jgi:hypothetical protein